MEIVNVYKINENVAKKEKRKKKNKKQLRMKKKW